ncbi:glutamate receptor 3-like isoform X2 [Rhopilema esculentum]|uniref:glutamate receptor 3-like isoform X2 n=1 Tax=Rhopilema esculentum TaxID=499914 RepID=UPI0031DF8FC3
MSSLVLLIAGLVLTANISFSSADTYNIVLLVKKGQSDFEKSLDTAIEHSIAYINTRSTVLRGTFIKLVVQKAFVGSGGIFEKDFLYGPYQYILGNATAFLLPQHIDQICILGEMLRVPMIALNYGPKLFCNNIISMRPDLSILNQALVAMVKETRPRVVAVVTEVGFGDFATAVMSHEHQVNHFSFQTISSINFTDNHSVYRAVKELKEFGAIKVLLIMQQENAYTFMKQVQSQNFKNLHAYRWFLPVLDAKSSNILKTFEGFLSLALPVDHEELNKTTKTLYDMGTILEENTNAMDPLLHDALTSIAYAIKASVGETCVVHRQVPKKYCPVRKAELDSRCKPLAEHLSEVMFRGLTGDVKFTTTKYRNITFLDSNEITRGKKIKLGTWSVPCEAFKWNPESSFAKQQQKLVTCATVKNQPSASSRAYQPKRRHLRVVAKVEEPFIFYNPSLRFEKPNDRFSGFCKDILDKLAEDLNFQYDILEPTPEFGKRRQNMSWSGMVGELIKKEADIAIGPLLVTSDRESVIDFSASFMDFTQAILIKKPSRHGGDSFHFLKPFTVGVWISILGSALVVALIMFLIERFSPMGYRKLAEASPDYSGSEFNFANSFWFATASLLQQGPDQTPRSIAGRILSTSFWFFVTIIMAAYVASLAGFYMTAKPETMITSLEDTINDGKYIYGTLRDGQTRKLLETSQQPLHRKMYKHMVSIGTLVVSLEKALERVKEEDYAFIGDQPLLEYFNAKQPCNTKIVKHVLGMGSYAFGLQLNSEWTNHFSVHLLKLRESGYIQGLRLKWWNEQAECKDENFAISPPSRLSFHDMAGICAILAVGICLSLFLLLFEIKFKHIMESCCSKSSSIPRKEQQMLKAPQITYLDYKSNGDYDLTKMYGSKYDDKSTLTNSFEESSKMYKDAPESTL